MEVKELMVGDWLQYYDCNLKKQCYAQVTSIQADGTEPYIQTSDSDVYYLVETYKPIPITPEILEKNGFVKELDSDGIHYRFTLIQGHSQFSLLYARSVFQWLYPIDFKYIHKLQHALRLCGIEKEIIL